MHNRIIRQVSIQVGVVKAVTNGKIARYATAARKKKLARRDNAALTHKAVTAD
jgi:hypothetical protein